MHHAFQRRALAIALCLASLLVLSGTSWGQNQARPVETRNDPWPQEQYWPADANGPYEFTRSHHSVPMDDLVELDGWMWVPKLPDGLRAPTVVLYWPYQGNLDTPGNDPAAGAQGGKTLVHAQDLAEKGYAVGFFSVRGTGNSGGCYDWYGERTGIDGAALVDWIAAQDWSNGRVGMIGLSEDATATWATAVHAPEALKTIVPLSGVIDRFAYQGTPNGLMTTVSPANPLAAYSVTGASPAIYRSLEGDPFANTDSITRGVTRDRACPSVINHEKVHTEDLYADQRHEAYWTERRYTDDFANIKAAVLSSNGFNDTNTFGFGAEAVGWDLIDAPLGMINGQWDHFGAIWDSVETGTYKEVLFRWFDFWLKGLGPIPPEVGSIQYQTDDMKWHVTNNWPPAGSSDEALYLTYEGLAEAPDGSNRKFTSVTDPSLSMCSTAETSELYVSEPVTYDTKIAGASFAYLRLTSSQGGGQVMVNVYEVGSDFSCGTNPDPTLAKLITYGGADLRFYDGSFEADPFPETPTNVRIDFEAFGQLIEAGNRIAVWVNAGDPTWRTVGGYTPEITVHGDGDNLASHIILPVVDDPTTPYKETLGGSKPKGKYPPRPNLPE